MSGGLKSIGKFSPLSSINFFLVLRIILALFTVYKINIPIFDMFRLINFKSYAACF